MVDPDALQAPLPPYAPRVGGGAFDDDNLWVGGSQVVALRRTRPKTNMARRPQDFRSAEKVESACCRGLPDERKIGLETSDSKMTLTSWIIALREFLEHHGMDSVFRVYDAATDTEIYLLVDWGKATEATIQTWLHEVTIAGVLGNADATDRHPVCTFDQDNLLWSGKAILNSVMTEFWETIEKDLGYDTSGPEAFACIIQKLQVVNASAVRALVDELKQQSLVKFPAQDVDLFGNTVSELARRIDGTGLGPPDLSSIVAVCFLQCDVLEFRLKAIALHDEVDNNADAHTCAAIVRTLKSKYRALKGQGLWTPADTQKKKHAEGEMVAMTGAINKLMAQLNGDLSGIKCHGCGKMGHYRNNCPEANGGNATGGTGDGARNWKRVAPADGAPETKTVEGKEYSFCTRCRKWQTGPKQHTTIEHVVRRPAPAPAPAPPPPPPPAAPANPQGNAAREQPPAPPPPEAGQVAQERPRLSLMGGLFMGALDDSVFNAATAGLQLNEVSVDAPLCMTEEATSDDEDFSGFYSTAEAASTDANFAAFRDTYDHDANVSFTHLGDPCERRVDDSKVVPENW